MKCIILAAGYATRLYPLTKNTPKPLLRINKKNILEHILDKLPSKVIDQIYIVTNNKYYRNFIDWKNNLNCNFPIEIINDLTSSNDDRLGSIGDVYYVIEKMKVENDFQLISGDNLFNFSLEPMVKSFHEGKNVLALYDVKSIDEARKMGVPTVKSEGIITDLVEKPQNPKSTVVSIGVYFFHREVIALLDLYLQQGNSADKVGEFISWLCHKIKLYSYKFDGANDIWFDIGTPSQLELANSLFSS